jgi:hypothetical protein
MEVDMSEPMQWEYRVEKFSNWKGVKPADINEALNAWGEEGWEVIGFAGAADGSLWVTAKKILTLRTRRMSSIPG